MSGNERDFPKITAIPPATVIPPKAGIQEILILSILFIDVKLPIEVIP